MHWGPRYLGGRKQIWSALVGTILIFRNTPLWERQKDEHTCLFGLEILFENTSVRGMKEKALRGTKEAFIGWAALYPQLFYIQ